MAYAHPEVLVSTDWVEQHKDDKNVRIVEVDVDTEAYKRRPCAAARSPGLGTRNCAITVRRDILQREQFEKLMTTSGISPDTTIVIYGDNNNWFAAWAFWQTEDLRSQGCSFDEWRP